MKTPPGRSGASFQLNRRTALTCVSVSGTQGGRLDIGSVIGYAQDVPAHRCQLLSDIGEEAKVARRGPVKKQAQSSGTLGHAADLGASKQLKILVHLSLGKGQVDGSILSGGIR
jgi:hypothetical protein